MTTAPEAVHRWSPKVKPFSCSKPQAERLRKLRPFSLTKSRLGARITQRDALKYSRGFTILKRKASVITPILTRGNSQLLLSIILNLPILFVTEYVFNGVHASNVFSNGCLTLLPPQLHLFFNLLAFSLHIFTSSSPFLLLPFSFRLPLPPPHLYFLYFPSSSDLDPVPHFLSLA